MQAMDPAIKIKNLSVTLGGTVKALKNVSLELPAGKTVGVIGPSGAGKTTLIRCIIGRLKTPGGSVLIFNEPAGSAGLRKTANYMTQELSVYTDLTVGENLAYFARMHGMGKKAARAAAAEALKAVEMTEKKDSLVSNLSGGQKQRVSLAIALLGSPKLMVLDEPTVGLDPVLRDKLWKLFGRLAGQGVSLIITSHVMDEAQRCDDLVLIRDGKVIAHDSPTGFIRSTGTKSVEEGFLKLAGGSE